MDSQDRHLGKLFPLSFSGNMQDNTPYSFIVKISRYSVWSDLCIIKLLNRNWGGESLCLQAIYCFCSRILKKLPKIRTNIINLSERKLYRFGYFIWTWNLLVCLDFTPLCNEHLFNTVYFKPGSTILSFYPKAVFQKVATFYQLLYNYNKEERLVSTELPLWHMQTFHSSWCHC